jgi:hypothetical protein
MKSPRWWTILAAGLTLGAAGWAVAQSAGSAKVILARAPVEMMTGTGPGQPLQKGATLAPGTRVKTGKGGAAEIVLGDGSLVRLGELSDLEIDRLDTDPAGQPTTSRFNLQSGQARAWVARQVVAKVSTGMGRFAVQTPTAVAAVRQTDFAVLQGVTPPSVSGQQPAGQTRVYTFAGTVRTEGLSSPQFQECTRNRFTQLEPQREPVPCRIIPLRERQDVLRELAFEAVSLDPGNPDFQALGALGALLINEKVAGDWAFGGGTVFKPTSPPAPSGTASVTVTVK